MSQNTVIAVTVVSSAAMLVLSFFAVGFICGCHFNKKKMDRSSNSKFSNSQRAPSPPIVLYEDILPDIFSRDLEMNQNMAYGRVTAKTVVNS